MCKRNEPLKRKMGKAGRCEPLHIGCCRILPLRAVKASAGVLLVVLCVWGCGVVFLNWFLVLHSSLPPSRAPPCTACTAHPHWGVRDAGQGKEGNCRLGLHSQLWSQRLNSAPVPSAPPPLEKSISILNGLIFHTSNFKILHPCFLILWRPSRSPPVGGNRQFAHLVGSSDQRLGRQGQTWANEVQTGDGPPSTDINHHQPTNPTTRVFTLLYARTQSLSPSNDLLQCKADTH